MSKGLLVTAGQSVHVPVNPRGHPAPFIAATASAP